MKKNIFPTNSIYFERPNGILYNENVVKILKNFPSESIDCVVTSPPYWSLRTYGESANTIWGGDENCEHEWVHECEININLQSNNPEFQREWRQKASGNTASYFCRKCGAWYGQLGLEPDFNLYIEHLLIIFDEIWRILKPTGTLWINISDTYGGSGMGTSKSGSAYNSKESYKPFGVEDKSAKLRNSKFNKSLLLIPERLAIAMVERGWKLRNKIVWYKTNGIPESVKDRFTKSYEIIFFFVKSSKYYFNQLFEPVKESSIKRLQRAYSDNNKYACFDRKWNPMRGIYKRIGNNNSNFVSESDGLVAIFDPAKGRNMRDMWEFATAQFSASKFGMKDVDHFAVFPEELPRRCIEAGCPVYVCKRCGKPREKIYERIEKRGKTKEISGKYQYADKLIHSAGSREKYYTKMRRFKIPKSMQVAFSKWLRNFTKGKEQILDKEFGKDKWMHWVRKDDSGQSLPSPEDYKKLKEILNLPDDWDKWMLETVDTIVDDSGNSYREYGWSEYCSCGCNEWEKGIVLDPFAGSGTTLVVAGKLGRNWIGIEINPDYCELSKRRIEKNILPLLEERVDE